MSEMTYVKYVSQYPGFTGRDSTKFGGGGGGGGKTIPGKYSVESLQNNSCTMDIAHNKESVTI
jgi:hypothetical protein